MTPVAGKSFRNKCLKNKPKPIPDTHFTKIPFSDETNSGKSKWGLCKWGLKVLVRNCHDCQKLPSFCDANSLYERPRKCTIAHDCAQIVESGLKPPFESPHLDFSDKPTWHELAVIWCSSCSPRNFGESVRSSAQIWPSQDVGHACLLSLRINARLAAEPHCFWQVLNVGA